MTDLQNIWKGTLEDIKNKINLSTYKAWFENITPVSLKKKLLNCFSWQLFCERMD
jgi:hypothetical protein